MAGARLVHFYPVSIATDYIGLNHTGFSYNGVMWITAVACRNMMPDPGFYADCLRASFEEAKVEDTSHEKKLEKFEVGETPIEPTELNTDTLALNTAPQIEQTPSLFIAFMSVTTADAAAPERSRRAMSFSPWPTAS